MFASEAEYETKLHELIYQSNFLISLSGFGDLSSVNVPSLHRQAHRAATQNISILNPIESKFVNTLVILVLSILNILCNCTLC